MDEQLSQARRIDGPPGWANWRAARAGAPSTAALEMMLFSDAWMTGEVSAGLGPYQFFNLVPSRHGHGLARPAVVLRIEFHDDLSPALKEKTDVSMYYGGWLGDELAALACLFSGARIRAGGETRYFHPDGDLRGRPTSRQDRPDPSLVTSPRGIVLPGKGGEQSLMPLEHLAAYPTLSSVDAVALVRAARLYQDAIWIAESEPNLAWIMLVSAVEVAANRWRAGQDEPLSRLRASKAEFLEYLDQVAVPGLAERIAQEFADTLGATRKFVEFLAAHLPSAPTRRPDEWRQLLWEPKELERAFRVIYTHRSRALHDGIPFPSPLLDTVLFVGRDEVASERPSAIAAHHQGATWLAKDLPMHLHMFEYIARTAILKWYEELAT